MTEVPIMPSSQMVCVTYGLDSSVIAALEKGTFKQQEEEISTYLKITDYILLVTKDHQNCSQIMPKKVLHIHCSINTNSRFLCAFVYLIRSLFLFGRLRASIRVIRAFGIQSIHVVLPAKLMKIPTIVSYHYSLLHRPEIERRFFLKVASILLEILVIRCADVVVALTERLATYAKMYGAKNVIVIPNYVDIGQVTKLLEKADKTLIRRRLGFPKNSKIILFVGRLHPIKNVDLLVKAFKSIEGMKSDSVYLVLVGDGPQKNQIKSLIEELNLRRKVRLLGHLLHHNVLELMVGSDMLVLPSSIEGNPRVIIEAAACKLPIVATNVPGINDVVENGVSAILVKPEVSELEEAIKLMLENLRLGSRLAEKAYSKVTKENDKNIVLTKNKEVVRSILRVQNEIVPRD